jgi:hypothetical protein
LFFSLGSINLETPLIGGLEMGLFGSGGKVTCTDCGGRGLIEGDYNYRGCSRCGGSGEGTIGDLKRLHKGSGKMQVADVAAHQRQLDADWQLAKENRQAQRERDKYFPGR